MACINFVGFLTGDTSECVSSTGGVSISLSNRRLADYGLGLGPTAGATTNVKIGGLTATGLTDGTTASVATSFFRFYFRVGDRPATTTEKFFVVLDSSAAVKFSLRVNTAGNLLAYNSAGSLLGTGPVLALSAWNMLQVKVGTGATVPYEVKVNGITQLSANGANLGTNNASSVLFGSDVNYTDEPVFAVTDFYWDNASYAGVGQCNRLIPVGNGFYITGTSHGAATLFGCLSQVPSDGDTTYIDNLGGLGGAYTATVAKSFATASIYQVKSLLLARNVGVGGSVAVRVRSGSTNSDSTDVATTSSYLAYSKLLATDPSTGLLWTPTGLDAAEVGVIEGSAGDRITGAMLMWDGVRLPFVVRRGPVILQAVKTAAYY